ncbi:MAG: hypothetical protein DRO39_01920 [Thermoprotei archaeon]|nr:MAG: hypothetical protein DRO39_01920 [Thermoprotei archaeon]
MGVISTFTARMRFENRVALSGYKRFVRAVKPFLASRRAGLLVLMAPGECAVCFVNAWRDLFTDISESYDSVKPSLALYNVLRSTLGHPSSTLLRPM